MDTVIIDELEKHLQNTLDYSELETLEQTCKNGFLFTTLISYSAVRK